MGVACSTHVEMRNSYKILIVKPEGRRPLERLRHICEDNIKIDLREVVFRGMD
jgi:hypothetical protein